MDSFQHGMDADKHHIFGERGNMIQLNMCASDGRSVGMFFFGTYLSVPCMHFFKDWLKPGCLLWVKMNSRYGNIV
jgi:hypothetical protein